MATRKRKRRKKSLPLKPLYTVRVSLFKGGKYQTETVAMSTSKKGALHQFSETAKDHGGYVSLEENKIIKERLSTEE
jgi:hypothetical protein